VHSGVENKSPYYELEFVKVLIRIIILHNALAWHYHKNVSPYLHILSIMTLYLRTTKVANRHRKLGVRPIVLMGENTGKEVISMIIAATIFATLAQAPFILHTSPYSGCCLPCHGHKLPTLLYLATYLRGQSCVKENKTQLRI
jgi:hypothetical protein